MKTKSKKIIKLIFLILILLYFLYAILFFIFKHEIATRFFQEDIKNQIESSDDIPIYMIDKSLNYNDLSFKYRLFIPEEEYYGAESFDEYLELFSKINSVPHTNGKSIFANSTTDDGTIANHIKGQFSYENTKYEINYRMDFRENFFTGKLEVSRLVIECISQAES